jgi:hypothetical protein
VLSCSASSLHVRAFMCRPYLLVNVPMNASLEEGPRSGIAK